MSILSCFGMAVIVSITIRRGLLMGSEILPVINQMIVGDVQNISSIDDRLKLNFETDNMNCTINEACCEQNLRKIFSIRI